LGHTVYSLAAATGFRTSDLQRRTGNYSLVSAIASAQPKCSAVGVAIKAFNDGPSTVTGICNIEWCRHDGLSNRLLCLAGGWRCNAISLRPRIA
jgi:hypothetical protein